MPNAKFIPAATWALLPEFDVNAGDDLSLLLDEGTHYPVLSDVASVTVSAAAETDLVMTIETTAPNETFTLPFRNAGVYNANVDMGNGDPAFDITTYNDPALTATYPTAGTHTIRVSGEIFALRFGGAADRAKLRTVENLGNLNHKDMQSAFNGCTGLTSFVAGNCTTGNVANWFAAFEGCDALVSVDLTGINWNSTTNLQNTWAGCDALTTINFEVVDTSNVNRMDECFHNCPLLVNLDMSNIDVSSLSATGGMFNFIDGADIKQADYDATLIQIASQAPLTDGVFFGSNLDQLYTTGGAAEAARTTIIQEGWFLNDSGSAVPQAMGAPSLAVDSATQLTATNGTAPPLDGLPISGYDLRYSVQGANTWTTDVSITSPRAITGLTAGTAYEVQTRAKNYLGAGAWSASTVATTNDIVVEDPALIINSVEYISAGSGFPERLSISYTYNQAGTVTAYVANGIDPVTVSNAQLIAGSGGTGTIEFDSFVLSGDFTQADLAFSSTTANRIVIVLSDGTLTSAQAEVTSDGTGSAPPSYDPYTEPAAISGYDPSNIGSRTLTNINGTDYVTALNDLVGTNNLATRELLSTERHFVPSTMNGEVALFAEPASHVQPISLIDSTFAKPSGSFMVSMAVDLGTSFQWFDESFFGIAENGGKYLNIEQGADGSTWPGRTRSNNIGTVATSNFTGGPYSGPHIFQVVFDTVAQEIYTYIDDVLVGTADYDLATFGTSIQIYLGMNAIPNRGFTGTRKFGGVTVTTDITAANRGDTYTYLANKWIA